MKAIMVKSAAFVVIVAFAFVLLPQHTEAQDAEDQACADAQLACAIAQIAAGVVCAERPFWCNIATAIADAVCAWADDVCD